MAFAVAAGAGAGVALGAIAVGSGVLWAGSKIHKTFATRGTSQDRKIGLFLTVFFFAALLAPFSPSSSNQSYRATKQYKSRMPLWPF